MTHSGKTNSWGLRTFAYVSMVIDHIACCLIFPMYQSIVNGNGVDLMGDMVPEKVQLLRTLYRIGIIIGRFAFPTFAAMLVEGFLHSHNRRAYCFRLLILAAVSEVPFDLLREGKIVYLPVQNTVFTLLAGLIMLMCLERTSFREDGTIITSHVLPIVLCAMLACFSCDSGLGGIVLIATLYLFDKKSPWWWIGSTLSVALLLAESGWWGEMSWEWLIVPYLFFMNFQYGTKGMKHKWYYLVYPMHFLILYAVKMVLLPGA